MALSDRQPGEYPSQWEADVVLADGGTVHIRPIRPEDGPKLRALHNRLSAETVYLRFFSPLPSLTPELVERFTVVDYEERMALVAELGDDLIAVARYDRLAQPDEAEVAFVVDDAHQGRGVGTILLEHLAAVAQANGIHRFVAETLPSNRRMLTVFHDAGFAEERQLAEGVVQVSFSIEPTEASLAAMHERERGAAARSAARLLAPRSVAVVGASREPGSIGHLLFRNLLAAGFAGPVYPVNPTATHVASVRAYPSVLDVPDVVDLAVIVVPAPVVPQVVEECARKRVAGLVVVASGFAETGPEGEATERELVERARRSGMRLIGPNSMGILNTAPDVSMRATFAPVDPLPGRVAVMSQSGALGATVLEQATRRGIGVSTFVSLGNKADVSGNDLLQYWEADPGTDIVLLHQRSFGNPRTFARVARRVSRAKPIVAVKSGLRTVAAGQALSATARLATPNVAVDALFRQTGIIRVDTLEQLFDVTLALSYQPLPAGRRVAIVSNARATADIAAEACEGAGLEVPQFTPATREAMASLLPGAASLRNPVDLATAATPEDYEHALRAVLADEGVDSVIAFFLDPVVTRPEAVAAAFCRAVEGTTKPVLTSFLNQRGVPAGLQGAGRSLPSFAFPEDVALAMARMAERGEWLRRPAGEVPTFDDIDHAAARMVIDTAMIEFPSGTWLDPASAGEVLAHYRIPTAPTEHTASVDEAVAVAEKLGFPVALKAGSGTLVRRSDVGGVHLDLASPDAVAGAWAAMEARLGSAMGGAVVQAMVVRGVETLVGIVQDVSFGPLVMFGTGGPAGELLGDVAFRILPLTDLDARELVHSVKGSPLLFGYRGSPRADVAALEDLLLRVGKLVDDVPELAEMDLSPVIVSASGAVAVDAKVRLAPWVPRPELAVRRLG